MFLRNLSKRRNGIMKKLLWGLGVLVFTLSGSSIQAQNKQLTIDDYTKWSRIVGTELSDDGKWFAYALRPNGGDDTLFVQSLSSDDVYEIPNANNAVFSGDGKWVSYMISPDQETEKKLRKSKKAVFRKAELLNLTTGEKKSIERGKSISFSNNSSHWVVHREKPEEDDSKHKGSDLVIHDLSTQKAITVGNVSEFAFNMKSSAVAYLVDANDKVGNGLYLLNTKSNAIKAVDTDSASYSQLTWDDHNALKSDWDKKGNKIAVLKGNTHKEEVHRSNELLVVSNVMGEASITKSNTAKLPNGYIISEDRSPSWTANSEMVLIGLKQQEEKIEMSKDTLANVDVWHWNDDRIQTVQMRQLNRDLRYTYVASFNTKSGSITQLTDEMVRSLVINEHNQYMVGRDEEPYRNDVNWGVSPADLYRIDIKSGNRVKFAEQIKRPLGYSPDGKFYLYQKIVQNDARLFVYNLSKNETIDLTKNTATRFVNDEHIYPHENPPYGVAGWTKNGKSVIMNTKYDLWAVALDGSGATNITKGEGEQEKIIFRYVNMNRQEPFIETSEELLLSAFGELSKKDGFYSLRIGKSPKMLVYEDASFGNPRKAENAKVVMLTRQTFEDFPDYYKTDSSFKKLDRVTDANPQQAEYAWGSRKLVEFESGKGRKVQGTLTLPANYEAGKRYPTIIYFYEKMSDRHHQYSMPTYDDRPHMSFYASNGYMVFMPDVYLEEGSPGTSSLDAITSAAQALIDQGYAEEENIGLQGHSWGGYQTSFILTQTDMFKTIVIGAPPTNLESFYNNIYGSSGTNHHGIMEIGQVRMGRDKTPWSAREAYQRENPMYHVPNINTPFLILHGTDDGAVDWAQGLELYNAARRNGKEVIFLSYPGEGHHLGREANQIDFQIRMKQYFDHHLKGIEAPDWMTNGVPHIQKKYRRAN